MNNQNNYQDGQQNYKGQDGYDNPTVHGDHNQQNAQNMQQYAQQAQNNVNAQQNQQDEQPDGYVNGVYMSDYVNIGVDGSITHDKGPTFKELKELREKGNNRRRIVAKKMYKNAIEEVKLDDGTVMDIDTAVEFAKEFGFENVNVGRARSGRQILRANPTDDPNKALRNLPTYE